MSSKRKIALPTVEENSEINQGIAGDPDTAELSDAQFQQLQFPQGQPFTTQRKKILNERPAGHKELSSRS
ncbi:MAG: hypothetical protein HQL52_06010 [Magnetococcales bacterium]|nr:hypothetical protein [Magnetococcales bacterium]